MQPGAVPQALGRMRAPLANIACRRLFSGQLPRSLRIRACFRQASGEGQRAFAGAVERAARAVDDAIRAMDSGMTPDAVLLDVEAAMAALGEITGRSVREEITNRIFERFCVGK